jgi:hypothetical protein
MKLKIVFGVTIPFLLIIALAIVASMGEVEVKRSFQDLQISNIFQSGKIKSSIELGTLTLSNDNTFTKKYEIPSVSLCLYDKDSQKSPMDAGRIQFSRGEREYYKDPYMAKGYNYETVEVKSGEELVMRVFMEPAYQFTRNGTYEYLVKQYFGYEELVIFENKKKGSFYSSYYSNGCHNINDDVLEDAIRIRLLV